MCWGVRFRSKAIPQSMHDKCSFSEAHRVPNSVARPLAVQVPFVVVFDAICRRRKELTAPRRSC